MPPNISKDAQVFVRLFLVFYFVLFCLFVVEILPSAGIKDGCHLFII